jgi:hypothetical protein
MRYIPGLGGHAPDHLRRAFDRFIRHGMKTGYFRKTVKVDKIQQSTSWLLGQLWNCTDNMPPYVIDLIQKKFGAEVFIFSYGQMSRFIKLNYFAE